MLTPSSYQSRNIPAPSALGNLRGSREARDCPFPPGSLLLGGDEKMWSMVSGGRGSLVILCLLTREQRRVPEVAGPLGMLPGGGMRHLS